MIHDMPVRDPRLLPQPKVMVLGERDRGRGPEELYYLKEPLPHWWTRDGILHRITVPAGFVFDGSSIPAMARPWFGGVWSLGLRPPIIHDLGYFHEGRLPWGVHEVWTGDAWVDALQRADGLRNCWPRSEFDRLFVDMMKAGGVSDFRRRWGGRAVRAAVWKNWDESPWEMGVAG